MIIIEQFHDISTGESGQREVERPDVLTQEQALIRDRELAAQEQRGKRLAELREALLDDFLSGAEPSPELRREYARLKREVL